MPLTEEADADLAACRESLRTGSRSFHAASLLLPRALREPASALYAFCREADDAVDAPGAGDVALRALAERLDGIYAGTPTDHVADRALAAVVRRQELPREPLDALLEGFAWDAAGRRYETISDVRAYGARVAGSVGVMMAVLMGVSDPQVLARACDLGVAMQLTNIARDVGEDARAGRLYLPREWLREEGIDAEAFLREPRHSPALGAVLARLLAEAERLYRRADAGIACLPSGCRPAIYAARRLYAAIGHALARSGHDGVSARTVVPGWPKLLLLLTGLPRLAWLSIDGLGEPALPETRFLVEALRRATVRTSRGGILARAEARFVRVLELFEELERRDRERAAQ
ncbi:MAG: phytoene/squalene synthase family protein, partial [Gammaproteobacteria bacterium]